MDWQKQTHDMLSAWMSVQKQMTDTWGETLRGMAEGKSPADGTSKTTWVRSVETWENSVKNFIDTQNLWAKMWARAVSATDMESASTYGRVVEDMTSAWSELQLKLWSAWFTTLRELDPEKMAGKDTPMGETGDLVEKWGKHVQAMMDAQGKLAKEWSEIAGATK